MLDILSKMDIWSLVDILLIWLVLYQFVRLIHGTRSEQVLVGILIVFIAFLLSSVAPLTTFHWLLNKFYASILLIIIILFQDELRSALSKIGKNPLSGEPMSARGHASQKAFDELVRAASALASQRIGALMVLEKNIILDRYIEVGVDIDAVVSHQLLAAIFHPSSQIHDGAVVVKKGRVMVAGCFLPLSQSSQLELHMGTRHRAAFGVSEQTDALVVLISEERGSINLVYDGRMEADLSAPELKQRLYTHFATDLHQESLVHAAMPSHNAGRYNQGQKPAWSLPSRKG